MRGINGARPIRGRCCVALFDEGRAALQQGNFDVACAKFKESNRIGPAVGTAFNLANCEEKRGRLATAWVLFKQVAGQMKPDDPRLSVAIERATALEKRTPRVILAADKRTPVETRVRLDDPRASKREFRFRDSARPPVSTMPSFALSGVEPRALTFMLAEGETTTLELSRPPPQQPTTHSSPPAGTAPSHDDRILGLERTQSVAPGRWRWGRRARSRHHRRHRWPS